MDDSIFNRNFWSSTLEREPERFACCISSPFRSSGAPFELIMKSNPREKNADRINCSGSTTHAHLEFPRPGVSDRSKFLFLTHGTHPAAAPLARPQGPSCLSGRLHPQQIEQLLLGNARWAIQKTSATQIKLESSPVIEWP